MTLVVRYNIFMDEIPSYKTLIYFSTAVALFLLYAHRANIKRLRMGTETRITLFPRKETLEP
jgi:glycerol-3-phosphate acyltransferase PlsY